MPTFKLATWNVRGFRDKSKQRDILSFAQAQGIDVLFIQEANFRSPLDVVAFRRDFRVDAFFSLTSSRACGVGVVFVSGRFRQKSHCTFGADGRMIMLDVYIEGKRVRFINLYAPVTRSDTNSFFKDLHQFLLEPLPHVLLGDFNCVVDSQRDVRGPGQGSSTYQAKELVKILRHLSLTHVWVHLHNDHFGPTRLSKTSASRIDRTYLPDCLLASVVECEVVDLPGNLSGKSDHLPLATTVRGSPGFSNRNLGWRLDPSLLHDEVCVQRVRDSIRESLENVPSLTPHVWDTLKEGWKKLLQEEGRDRKRRLSAQMGEILRRMRIVKEAESLTSCTREYLETLQVTILSPAATQDTETCKGARSPRLFYRPGNERIRGFPLTGTGEIKVLAYADDISLFVRDTRSLREFWNTFNRYAEVSGAKINEGKSKALLFGSFPRESLVEIQTVSMVKVLGIYFTCDGVAEATWQRALERAHLVATRIQHLDLTLREKALAVKTSVCAFANYVCRVAVMPSKTASQLNSVINTLLWDGKPAPVKRNLLQLPESEGGLGLPHVMTIGRILALKAVRLLYQASEFFGKGLLLYWCSTNTKYLDADRHTGPVAEFPSPFYKMTANTKRMLDKEAPSCDIDRDPPARIAETLTRSQLSPEECGKTATWKRSKAKLSRGLPREVEIATCAVLRRKPGFNSFSAGAEDPDEQWSAATVQRDRYGSSPGSRRFTVACV
ncbi:hypothetical protein HPB50_007872 [Hyalomma asiaticum]|uniref:Uncharacterized protein n=1 Tax=Hyalomma asiaticum TaxID=266040 RepID=A0ACB7TGS4_HYAAI|nr:hypothetical protein HPB50_007872 [Hyalomma asiaticum]